MGGIVSKPSLKYLTLKKYLDDGGDPNAYNSHGYSLLYEYSNNYNYYLDCYELLLERGANPNQSHRKNHTGYHPICCIAIKGDIERMKLLLKFGANPNCIDVNGRTPLHHIYLNNTPVFLKLGNLLIEHGADITIKTKHGDFCMDLLVKELSLVREYYNNCSIEYGLQRQSSIHMKLNLFMKHNCPLKYHSVLKQVPTVLKYWCKRKWVLLLAVVKLLSLHQRAVVSANHPNRLKQMGVFEEVN